VRQQFPYLVGGRRQYPHVRKPGVICVIMQTQCDCAKSRDQLHVIVTPVG
jgi:hypothetical protein